jgi:hypothetical protein
MSQYQSVNLTGNNEIQQLMHHKNYGSLVNSPHSLSNRFELPTLNVKEVSSRLLN